MYTWNFILIVLGTCSVWYAPF